MSPKVRKAVGERERPVSERLRQAETERVSAAEFAGAIRSGRFLPGDAVCYAYGRPSVLARGIRRVQRRALTDLLAGSDDPEAIAEVAEAYCGYTHAGMILDEWFTVEMTAPRERVATWETVLTPGDRVLIVRPRLPALAIPQFAPLDGAIRAKSLRHAVRRMEEQVGTAYPWRELLTYWFSSLPGAIAAPHFAEHFRDHRRNVCSGAVWAAWVSAGAVTPASWQDAMPESWYPARLAMDREYLELVACMTCTEDCRGCTPAPLAEEAKGEGQMKTRRNWFSLIELLVVVAICGILAAMLPGCAFGGGRVTFVSPFSPPSIVEGSTGVQVKGYKPAAQTAVPEGTGTAATDGTKMSGTAEQVMILGTGMGGKTTDVAAATDRQAQATQTAGAVGGNVSPNASPQDNGTVQIAPNTPVSTGSGTSQVTSPTATQAGSGSTPGAVTGGSGAGTQTGATTTTPATTTSGTSTATEATTTTGTTTN